MTSALSLAELRALVASPLSDVDLQKVIDREESWLARQIGPLTGSRTETYYLRDIDTDDPLALRRPTSSVTVKDGVGTTHEETVGATHIRLLANGTAVERADSSWLGPKVTAVYTPNDGNEVKRVLIDLLRLTLTDTGYDSETIQDYTYRRGSGALAMTRRALARSLVPSRKNATVRLRSSVSVERIGWYEP